MQSVRRMKWPAYLNAPVEAMISAREERQVEEPGHTIVEDGISAERPEYWPE